MILSNPITVHRVRLHLDHFLKNREQNIRIGTENLIHRFQKPRVADFLLYNYLKARSIIGRTGLEHNILPRFEAGLPQLPAMSCAATSWYAYIQPRPIRGGSWE